MKVAIVEGGMKRGGNLVGPEKFTKQEIEFARSKGVIIKEHYSETVRGKYLANTCSRCRTFAGEHYWFTEYFAHASYGELPSTTFEIGYHCDHCAEQNTIEENEYEN